MLAYFEVNNRMGQDYENWDDLEKNPIPHGKKDNSNKRNSKGLDASMNDSGYHSSTLLYADLARRFNECQKEIEGDFSLLDSKKIDEAQKEKVRRGLSGKVRNIEGIAGEMRELELPEADCQGYQDRVKIFKNRMYYISEYGKEANKAMKINNLLLLALRMEDYESAAELKKMMDKLLAPYQIEIEV